MNIIDAIDQEARALPLTSQQEVLDFIRHLRKQASPVSATSWLERAWGAMPDFPDRSPQPLLAEPEDW